VAEVQQLHQSEGREAVSRASETPLEAARRYVMEQETKVSQQMLLIRQLAASGRSTVTAKRDLAGMGHSLALLVDRMERLAAVGPDASA
jgi:alkylation response protein AidB-like acyl-CoA dehydrogenase